MTERPDRNLAMELVRVTEAAALAAGRWIGRGDKNKADAAAVDAMRLMIDSVSMHGTVVIGEGEKDEAPMLFNGEEVGNGEGPGIGGTPEGVISAAALKALGGAIQGRLYPRDDGERQVLLQEGFDIDRVLTTDDLVSGNDVFFAATGITDGSLLGGVKYWPDGAT